MENRKKPANPAPHAPPTKTKPDDFEPPETSLGPQKIDVPTSPPYSSFDCGNPPPAEPGK